MKPGQIKHFEYVEKLHEAMDALNNLMYDEKLHEARTH